MKTRRARVRVLLSAVVALGGGAAFGQGLDNLWLGGYDNWFGAAPWGGSSINFTTGTPVIYQDPRSIDLLHTAANISDSNGELLFFTNGVVIGKADGDTMQNGAGLNPSDYTDNWYPDGLLLYQADLIIPKPGHPNRYFLFHNTVDVIPGFTSLYVYLTEVDMSLDGGSGAVLTKNQVLHTGPLQNGHLTGVKHGNGRDWWVFAHALNTDEFLRWLVTPQGVFGPWSQSVGAVRDADPGQVVFSSDGGRFAYFAGLSGLDVFEVDRCSGLFSVFGHVDVLDGFYGIGASFSPNGRFVYLSNGLDMFQVDTEAADMQGDTVHIARWDSTYSPEFPFATVFGASKLAPDGKIYISTLNSTDKLHVINYPDSFGLACGIVQHAITLPTYWKNSLPNHPNYHLGALDGSVCDSLDVGLVEQPENLNMSLYPNPNTGAFAITYAPQPSSGTLEVHALDGRVVHRESVAPWSQLKGVELPRLAPGLYQCTVRFGAHEGVRRFVVE
ncbi:MAG: T9SS type A sorting domain-containing protein [Flavobacteriales bacterium]|nr:MAG: T9SS type A sorting domain-containing protein [Flavobacteriales bacterium]